MELAREDKMELAIEGGTTESAASEPGVVTAAVSVKTEESSRVDPALLDRLLEMANVYRNEGNLWQAMAMYWELVEDYPGTPQSEAAWAVLLELAATYEHDGARHLARGIYERLLSLSC